MAAINDNIPSTFALRNPFLLFYAGNYIYYSERKFSHILKLFSYTVLISFV